MIWIFVGLAAFTVLFMLGVRQFACNSAQHKLIVVGTLEGTTNADVPRTVFSRSAGVQPTRLGRWLEREFVLAGITYHRSWSSSSCCSSPPRCPTCWPAARPGVRRGRGGRRLPAAPRLAAPIPGTASRAVRPADPRARPRAVQRRNAGLPSPPPGWWPRGWPSRPGTEIQRLNAVRFGTAPKAPCCR